MSRPPLGQHFLVSPMPARVLTDALKISSEDTVVEVGPGKGALTKFLVAQKPKKLILIEQDVLLAANLVHHYKENTSVKILHGDVREVLKELSLSENWKLAGNIPYYLTSNLLRIISNLSVLPSATALLVQKEVAVRITAQVPHMNKLAAHIGIWAESKMLRDVPKELFKPQPKVTSSIILLTTKKEQFPQEERQYYAAFVNHLFKQPRKVIGIIQTYAFCDMVNRNVSRI